MRCDFNVPLEGDPPAVVDDARIRAALPTLRWLLDQGASVTACSHLGRPPAAPDPRFEMAPVRARLDELVGPGAVTLLDNLRFDPGEEANSPDFAARLARGQDVYVNDAFGAAHRSHASVAAVATLLPHAAGRLLAREVEVLLRLRDDPPRPFVVILGGAKVSDKLGLLGALLDIADRVLVGGGMAFTLLAASGASIGASLVEEDHIEAAGALLDSGRIGIPTDVVAADRFAADAAHKVVPAHEIPKGWMGLDIGPVTAASFAGEVAAAGSVFWNGPLGVFEWDAFSRGSRRVAAALASAAGFTVAGGGDVGAALARFGVADAVDHMSTGGGASLELLEKGDLPGLAALRS